ncbi:MAG: (Fe-S)-binding protein [bacterium]|jgi:Fe-S oxidoreductase|nr:(Fe-S)-binding protein [bacterium]
MFTSVIWTVALLAALTLFSFQIYKRLLLLLKAHPTNRSDQLFKRIKRTFVYAFGQLKFFQGEQPAGIFHILVFWGFLILGAQAITMFLRGWKPDTNLPFLDIHHWGGPYMMLRDLTEVIVFICVISLLVRWLITRPQRLFGFKPAENRLTGESHREALLILCFIAIIVVSTLVYDGGRLVFLSGQPEIEAERSWSPVSKMVGNLLAGFGPDMAEVLSNIAWWVHNLIVLIFLNLLPSSKHFHVITAVPNVFFSNLDPPGRLTKQDLETAEIFGISQMSHFNWKQLLDLYTCTECGRCSSMCPATDSGKPLAPRQLVLDLRDYLYKHPESILDADDTSMIVGENVIHDEVLWSCSTCLACEDACPVLNEYLDKIIDMRRHLVQEEARFPAELTRTFKGLETQGNPWGLGNNMRKDWAEGKDIPLMSEHPDAEYLFYIGCAGSFDDRAKKITRAVTKIFNAAGLSYAVLGNDEPCDGDTARRLGNEYLFQSMAENAINVFTNYNVKKIITNCPHCFNSIKNEFPQFGGHYDVFHTSEIVARFLKDEAFQINKEAVQTIVYHDSCYLGRYNKVYVPPREILKAIPGVILREAERNFHTGMCCGAGGGRMWMEEESDQRVSTLRTEQLINVNPDIIATACPYCLTMLNDDIRNRQLEDTVQIQDIMEILAGSII